jgi:hypothetical protein
LLAIAPVAVMAQPTLDTPTVSVVQAGHAAIVLQITAGASGAPAGFTVDWMTKADYDLYGWPAEGYQGYNQWCTFNGTPVFHMGSGSYILGPNGSTSVYLGELFDEGGMTTSYVDELPEATDFVVRVHAESDGNSYQSPYSPNYQMATSLNQGCTYTLGYWKNHPSVWPVLTLTLGTQSYNQAQLLSILGQPSGGNGLVILCHQLIAAKLNVANGASAPSGNLIGQGDALVGSLICPPVGSGFLSPSSVNTVSNGLDDYNNGRTGPGHCNETPTHTTTWGGLKTLYR